MKRQPVRRRTQSGASVSMKLCAAGQHRQTLDRVLADWARPKPVANRRSTRSALRAACEVSRARAGLQTPSKRRVPSCGGSWVAAGSVRTCSPAMNRLVERSADSLVRKFWEQIPADMAVRAPLDGSGVGGLAEAWRCR